MAAFDFPNNPSLNQQFTQNGASWFWNGVVWERFSSSTVIGPQGIQGTQGNQGVQGLQGKDGANAGQGTQGAIGNFQGTQGNQGVQGIQGKDGTNAGQGSQGLSNQGAQGTQGRQGNQGTGTQGAQGAVGNFQGTQGTQGRQGVQGPQGVQNSQGTQGNQGTGFQGSQGLSGSFAAKGDQGTQGLKGLQGAQGLQGPFGQGIQGLQGGLASQGTAGFNSVDVEQSSYTCTNPILTNNSEITITDASNAYGTRYVTSTQPANACNGDIWYDISGGVEVEETISVPIGGIIMWSGSSLPSSKWALCDGNNGTPDLRNRFIMAAHSISKSGTTSQAGPTFDATTGVVNESGQYAPGDIGGEAAHQLTEAELASHNHSYDKFSGQVTAGGGGAGQAGTTNSQTTGSAGSDNYHENRPPYYALAFLMRIS